MGIGLVVSAPPAVAGVSVAVVVLGALVVLTSGGSHREPARSVVLPAAGADELPESRSRPVDVFRRIGEPLRRRARCRPDLERDRAVGRQVVVVLAVTLYSPPLAVVIALGWSALRIARHRAASRRRERRLIDELPEVIDLIRLAVDAGLNVRLATAAVAEHGHGMVAAELDRALALAQRGARLADALEPIGALGSPVRPLLDALLASERYGAPIGAGLERAAAEARQLRRRRGEEAARRVPVKMLFPLVFCTLPALGLLTVVPLLARSIPSIAP